MFLQIGQVFEMKTKMPQLPGLDMEWDPETLLKEIEALVDSLMDQEVYEEFLRAGAEKLIGERQVKEITEEDLGGLLTMLTDYKQAIVSMYGNVNSGMMGKVMTFFKNYMELCNSISPDSEKCDLGEHIVPRCWWDNSIISTGVPISLSFNAGIVDGAYSTLYGLGQLTGAIVSMNVLAECWFNPLSYIWGNGECSDRRASTIQTLIFVKDLINKDSKSSSVVSSFFNDFGTGLTTWKEQTFCFGETAAQGRCCSYHQGKLVFDIASLFFGVGEVKAGLQGFKLGTFLEGKIATQMTGLLRKIKLPTSLIMKPIRKTGMAIGTAAMLAFSDPALVIKPITASAQALVAKTSGKASAQAMARVGEMLQGGATKAINEAVGSLDDIALKLTDELGEEVLKDAGKIILNQKTPLDDIIISHVNKSNVLSPFAVLALAGTISRISETSTPGCEVCKTRSKAICDKYVEVRNRAVSGGLSRAEADTAVNRICAAIATETGLQAVAGILLTNSTDYMPSLVAMVSFLKDINKNFGKNGLNGNLASFVDSRWFRAWTVVFKARCAGVSNCNENTKADWAVLQPVDEMFEYPSLGIDRLGGYDGLVEVIKKNNRAPCNTCDPPSVSYLNKMDQYLKDIIYFISNFSGKEGADKVLGKQGIRNNSRHQIEATAFILRVLNEKKMRSDQVSSFEEIVESMNDAGETNTAFADIVTTIIDLGYGYRNPRTLIECKSWAADGIAFQKFVKGDGNAYKQFKTYLGDIGNMDWLEYWFDGRKANSSQVKEKFQELMYKNGALTPQGVEIFNVIWGNTSLRRNLFPVNNTEPLKGAAVNEFKQIILTFDNKFYNIIHLK